MKQGFNSQAQCVLQQLRITRKSAKSDEIPSVVLDELQDIQEAVEMDKKMKPATWRELLGPKLRKRQGNGSCTIVHNLLIMFLSNLCYLYIYLYLIVCLIFVLMECRFANILLVYWNCVLECL